MHTAICFVKLCFKPNYYQFLCDMLCTACTHISHSVPHYLGIRVSSDLLAVGFRKKSIAQSTTIATPPWLLSRPVVDLRLHCSDKDITPPDIFKNCFMNCVTATVITIASTQTVPKAMTG